MISYSRSLMLQSSVNGTKVLENKTTSLLGMVWVIQKYKNFDKTLRNEYWKVNTGVEMLIVF